MKIVKKLFKILLAPIKAMRRFRFEQAIQRLKISMGLKLIKIHIIILKIRHTMKGWWERAKSKWCPRLKNWGKDFINRSKRAEGWGGKKIPLLARVKRWQWVVFILSAIAALIAIFTSVDTWMFLKFSEIDGKLPALHLGKQGLIILMFVMLILVGILAAILAIFKRGWKGGLPTLGIAGVVIGLMAFLTFGNIPKVKAPFDWNWNVTKTVGAALILSCLAVILYFVAKKQMLRNRGTAFWSMMTIIVFYLFAIFLLYRMFPDIMTELWRTDPIPLGFLMASIILALLALYAGSTILAPILATSLIVLALFWFLGESGIIDILARNIPLAQDVQHPSAVTVGPSTTATPPAVMATKWEYQLTWKKPAGFAGSISGVRGKSFFADVVVNTPEKFDFITYCVAKDGKPFTVEYQWDKYENPCGTWFDPSMGWSGTWAMSPCQNGWSGWIKTSYGEGVPATLMKVK